MKKVTVIVTTYNQENTIARTLESILSQKTDFDFEILIGEDASTDQTRNICEEYKSRFPDTIRLMPGSPNKGIVDNYYDCLLSAEGEYIADCAGDDYWIDDHKLQNQVDIMDSDPEITLCHTNWVENDGIHTKHDQKFQIRQKYLKPIIDGKELITPLLTHEAVPIIHLCTALYRRDTIIECYMADPSLFRDPSYTCEDLQIEVALASRGKIAWLPNISLCYSVGHTSISSPADYDRRFRFYFGTLLLSRRMQKFYGKSDSLFIEYFSRMVSFLLAQAIRSNNPQNMQQIKRFMKEIPHKNSLKNFIYLIASRLPWKIFKSSD